MSRRTLYLLLFVPLLILLTGVGSYYAWGGVMKRRYHQRLDALRAEGIPTRWEDLVEPIVLDADNGAALLLEAEAIREAVRDAAEEDIGWLSPWEVARWDEEPEVEVEERPLAVQIVARLAPYYGKLDEVLRRPQLKLPREEGLGGVPFVPVQNAVDYAIMRARIDPDWRDQALDRVLGLLVEWRAHSDMELITRPIQWRSACGLLRRMLQDDSAFAEPLLGRWGATLERSENGLPADIRSASRANLVLQVWLHAEWAAGRDPLAPMRASFEEFGSLVSDVKLDEETRRFTDGIASFTRSGLDRPWEARWWGRPFLWRAALTMVDRDAHVRQLDLEDLAAVRTWLVAVDEGGEWRNDLDRVNRFRLTLRQLAVTRLARLALAVHDFAIEKGRAPEELAELASLLGGAVPEDPLTGEAFRYEVLDDEVILQTDPRGALIRLVLPVEDATEAELLQAMEEAVLRWRLPVP